MKLALDTSQSSGSIALWDSGRVVYSASFDISVTHSETLMPQVDAALKFCGFQPADISAVYLANGPGSFTGLRIGLATAKGIAYGLKIPLLTFSTLRLAALPRYHCGRKILAVIDAKMHEVYAALYDEDLQELAAPAVCYPEELLNWEPGGAYLLGSGARLLEPVLTERSIPFVAVPETALNAAGVFTLASLFPREESYSFQQLASLEPIYLRESTAQVRRQGK
ncbi:MAG: tRNA (adenosine(37)-N6)-threonylcarbamoyltransferase complex dimerization subunit type 1 TsaB [Candidatus Cloacimonetes bacterium]|nr:tRNA (adenosine(37)-N6)-threonylcarbamoyltransferase complex dimerization subunit type 1 TsaB [Candidatus Cloacimonadota bacterium]